MECKTCIKYKGIIKETGGRFLPSYEWKMCAKWGALLIGIYGEKTTDTTCCYYDDGKDTDRRVDPGACTVNGKDAVRNYPVDNY